jgi:hypothetical protein
VRKICAEKLRAGLERRSYPFFLNKLPVYKHFLPLAIYCLPVIAGGMPLGKKTAFERGAGNAPTLTFFAPDNPAVQYMGRIDFSNPRLPRFWAPGVTVRIRFQGNICKIIVHDEVRYGNSHNFIEVAVEGRPAYRVKLRGREDTVEIATSFELRAASKTVDNTKKANESEEGRRVHMVTICKDTEAGIGWLEFAGVFCERLLAPPALPLRKIEFIGNSITCGSGIDVSDIPCGKGTWYDQHNAWMSYGARTARDLHAQWHLSSVSGIGLVHSCCDMHITMPEVFDKMDQREGNDAWDFGNYIPDVVTICLGQNDGIQDSAFFCRTYLRFIRVVRTCYPLAHIVLLTSPMADSGLTVVLKRYLTAVVAGSKRAGDERVSSYFFSKRYFHGCGGHPDMQEHEQIAAELTGYLRGLMGWR